MATLKIDGPDGKTYRVEVPEGSAPEATAEQFAAEMWPNLAKDTGLSAIKNTADIAGAGVGAALAGTGELARAVMGKPPELGQRLYDEFWGGKKNTPKSATEAIGRFIPTSPTERAKQLGVPLTSNRESLARGAEYLTGAAAFGAPAKMAALSGIGGAAGQRVGGDEGAIAAGLALPMLALKAPKGIPAPTLDEVKAARKAAYATADQGGAVISRGSLGRMLQDMHVEMAPKYFAKDTHPQAFKAFRELTDEATKGHVDVGRIFKMRGRMGALSGAAGTAPQDADMLRTMRRVLDNHLTNAAPVRDIIAGNADAIKAFREGTSLFRREQGLKTIERLVENAKTTAPTYTAAGFDTALRNQFKALVKNQRQMRFFTKPEQDALKQIARGTPVGNAMRQLGRLAPQNILNSLLLANVHPAAAALTVPGAGARLAASKSTQRNIKLAQDLIARGYPVPPSLRRYLDAAPVGAGVFAGQGSQTRQ